MARSLRPDHRIWRAEWVREGLVVGLLSVVVLAFARTALGPGTPLAMDSATAFYPWFTYLGARLRAGEIPAWNPYQFGGTPFAADPESGWMYLPAMLLFAALPAASAAPLFVLLHPLIAGLSTYALGRSLGLGRPGSFAAGLAYAGSGFVFGHSACCFAYAGVATWFPLVILGAERAAQAAGWERRAGWWAVGGLGLSQVLGAWVGQGAYYVVLALAAYVVYRRAAPWPRTLADGLRRVEDMAADVLGIGLFGAGLAAAGLLPRIEFNLQSNLPLGYPDGGAAVGAAARLDWALVVAWGRLLVEPGFYALGGVTAVLALCAVIAARPLPRGVAALALLSLAALAVSLPVETPLRTALAWLPAFDRLTGRSPQRAMLVLYLGPALLVGALVGVRGVRPWALALGGPLVAAGFVAGLLAGAGLAPVVTGGFLLLALLLIVYLRWPAGRVGLSIAVIAILLVDLRGAARTLLDDAAQGQAAYEVQELDLTTYFAPSAAARFLLALPTAEPFRYAGYVGHVFGGPFPYTLRWTDPAMRELEVNNRGLVTGLEDIQGYNPLRGARYDDFVAALNGEPQNYHHADVYPAGLDSPLLDLLNTRYLIMPTSPAFDQTLPRPTRPLEVVFQSPTTTVYENPAALPRAWLVYAARQASSAEALELLRQRAVDPREVALLEVPPPGELNADPGSTPGQRPRGTASVVQQAPELLRVRVETAAPGLLVLSEIFAPGWAAFVDGAPVPLYAADGALRAVPVHAGAHEIEVRYVSPALSLGLGLSLLTVGMVLALGVRRGWQGTPGRTAPGDPMVG